MSASLVQVLLRALNRSVRVTTGPLLLPLATYSCPPMEPPHSPSGEWGRAHPSRRDCGDSQGHPEDGETHGVEPFTGAGTRGGCRVPAREREHVARLRRLLG